MPAFEGSGGYSNGQVQIRGFEAVFISADQEFAFPSKVLLEEFPDSHHYAMAEALQPHRDYPQPLEKPPLLRRLKAAVFPGYMARTRAYDASKDFTSIKEWLTKRAHVLVPNRDVSRVEIRWYHETIALDHAELHRSRESDVTLIVPL